MLLLPAVAGLPRVPEDHGSQAAEEPVNSLKEVEFPVSHFTSHTTAQLPSLSSICAVFMHWGEPAPFLLTKLLIRSFSPFCKGYLQLLHSKEMGFTPPAAAFPWDC